MVAPVVCDALLGEDCPGAAVGREAAGAASRSSSSLSSSVAAVRPANNVEKGGLLVELRQLRNAQVTKVLLLNMGQDSRQ